MHTDSCLHSEADPGRGREVLGRVWRAARVAAAGEARQ